MTLGNLTYEICPLNHTLNIQLFPKKKIFISVIIYVGRSEYPSKEEKILIPPMYPITFI